MINREATIRWKGYDPDDLSFKSNKRIWANCDICGKGRWIAKAWYSDLCRVCSGRKNGLNNSGMKNGMYGVSGKDHPNWKDNEIIKICPICNIEFPVPPWLNDRIFCGRECYSIWWGRNQKGKNNPMWKGGISYDPYCIKFNERFKESIRDKFDRKCFLCNKTEQEQMNDQKLRNKIQCRLSVHHVNYDKNCLCNDVVCEFVPLCLKCHSKTNTDRSYWENLILIKLGV